MDYKEKYYEALERARAINNGKDVDIEAGTTTCEYIFPELKESEDEKIRKSIISILNGEIRCVSIEDTNKYVTWLEKQGEIDLEHYKDGENEKRKFVGYGFLKCKGDFLSFKEGETYWLEYVGNDNYNVRSDNLLGQTFHIKPVELYTVFRPTTWLEKQGEKPQGKSALEAWKDMRLEVYQQVSGNRHEPNYSDDSTKMFSLNDIDEIIEKINEQKPADKVKSKFNIGDWIVGNDGTFKITRYEDEYGYELTGTTGYVAHFISPDYVESNFHLWSINDAKDGDVLAFYCEYKGNKMIQVGIIEKYVGKHGGCSNTFKIYVGVNWENNLQIGDYMGCSDIQPATKEQRDLLFQKMKEAGYEWDAEKKELKKISHKTLDPDKVIEWLEDQACQGWIEDIEVEKFVDKFKKDFGL